MAPILHGVNMHLSATARGLKWKGLTELREVLRLYRYQPLSEQCHWRGVTDWPAEMEEIVYAIGDLCKGRSGWTAIEHRPTIDNQSLTQSL